MSWTSHTTNGEVLRPIGSECVLLNTNKTRKLLYFGRIIRGA